MLNDFFRQHEQLAARRGELVTNAEIFKVLET